MLHYLVREDAMLGACYTPACSCVQLQAQGACPSEDNDGPSMLLAKLNEMRAQSLMAEHAWFDSLCAAARAVQACPTWPEV
jgi:hypothetical protein